MAQVSDDARRAALAVSKLNPPTGTERAKTNTASIETDERGVRILLANCRHLTPCQSDGEGASRTERVKS